METASSSLVDLNISEVDNSDTSSEILTVMKEEIGEDDLLKSDCHMLMFDLAPYERFTRENTLGMTVTSGSITIKKDANNLIGISIGGGAPLCPCLYIVQIFDNTAASKDGTLQSGDELVAVNGQPVKGKTKVEVAKMIQAAKDEVIINYNKLHADPRQGKSLDIVLKKVKHRLVENMSSSTADALGLSRAILCNDTLVKKLQELQDTEVMYRGLVAWLISSYFM
ncbi:Arfaptin-like domain [Popillia japonica]|uniref:Arfaptin-like domain n=1 Tax=Popillia japonica TaxID=7064 RepID=A0AAW1IWI7_POPJA